MTSKCFVCDGDIEESGDHVSRVFEKGILSLIKARTERRDNKSSQLHGLKSLLVHTSCRKKYTRTQSIVAELKRHGASTSSQRTETVSLRSSLPEFDFKNNCFLCTDPLENEEKKPREKRRLVYQVRTFAIQKPCVEAGLAREDKWGEEVVGHLSSINDLVAEEAVYHNDCRVKFMKPLYKQPKLQTDDYISKGMEEIYAYRERAEEILKMIFCRCTKDCSSGKCGCRKGLMNCSPLCQNCQGNCLNGVPILFNEDDDPEKIEPLPTSIEDMETEDEESIKEEDEEYEPPPEPIAGPSRPKRAKTTTFWYE